MLGCEPIIERQRRHAAGAAGLGGQMAVAVERADDIAAAMQIEEGGVAVV